MERKAEIKRKTSETDITLTLELGKNEKSVIDTGIQFFDHMLDVMARHGHIFLDLKCTGDTGVDYHHTIEDVGICLGKAFSQALGKKQGISRFGNAIIPMDDALTMTAIDISGRAYYAFDGDRLSGQISRYSEELTDEFLRAFAFNAELTLHVKVFYGTNRHHIHESIYKSLGVALYKAYSIDSAYGDNIPSTKGIL